MDYTLFDGLALGDVLGDPVNPKPFRLFAVGENQLTRNGKSYVLTLTAEQIGAIADYHAKKGEKIPIDSRHALFLAAEKAGVSENDASRAVPSKVAALGFASLEARDDGLYASGIELLPLAAELFRNGSLRYWSPVIRGLDGKSPLRVTSIAMDNVPALNGLDVLAAGGEQQNTPAASDRSDRSDKSDNQRKDITMTETEKALRNLLGEETLALSDDTDAEIAGKLAALGGELEELRKDREKLAALELSAETEKKTALIDKAIAENRATNAERDGLMKLDLAWLSAELPKRAAGSVPTANLPEEKDKEIALTAEEKAFAKARGISEEEFLKSKKGVCK